MKMCSRPNCSNAYGRNGLCQTHARLQPHGYMPAEPAHKRIQELIDQGCNYSVIGQMCGVSGETIRNIANGRYTNLKRRTWDAVMNNPAAEPEEQQLIDATGTSRRIRALCAIGWPQQTIADEHGAPTTAINRITHQTMVSKRWADKIATTYTRLSMTPGPSTHTRLVAKKKGWVSPLAWDEETIDDPRAKPDVGEKSRPSFIEKFHELRDLGVTRDDHIAQRLGITLESARRERERHGLKRSA